MRAYEYFLEYVKINSQSSDTSGLHPSTTCQFDMAGKVAGDLEDIGAEDVTVTDKCYVYGSVPASSGMENEKKIGLIAHMDTATSFSGENVRPRIVENYDGENIVLNKELNIILDTKVFPQIKDYIGNDIIVTDGTTLLGADDKAGIAEIIAAIERIIEDKIPHPAIKIAFTPDEEVGDGTDYFDVKGFGADYAYTIDGGRLGELEYENFNAASAVVTVHGNSIHPGQAKNKMKNAILVAMEFNGMLPPEQTPSHTEGYEGFYHITDIAGDEEKTVMKYIIRDHDREIFEKRKNTFRKIADYINDKYGETIDLEIKDTYYNMKEKILPHMEIVEKAERAFKDNGVEPIVQPIRGGTDGANLSYMGLPCPNLSTGGHNYHGKFEYIPVQSMDKMVDVIVSLVTGK